MTCVLDRNVSCFLFIIDNSHRSCKMLLAFMHWAALHLIQVHIFMCICVPFVSWLQRVFVFLFVQRHNGEVSSGGSVKLLGRNRFSVSFQLEDVQKPEQDLYRCVTQSSRSSGVSNFAELIVKGKTLVFFLLFPPIPISLALMCKIMGF